MNLFLSGAIAMGFLACGLFFFRFWRVTSDRLFVLFAIAFWILAVERFLLISPGAGEARPYIYLPRLVACIFILLAVIDRNRGTARDRQKS